MKHLKIAATADGGIVIEGYGVPFGGPIKGRDLHGQFFSKKTDFALDLIPDGQRPLLFQHGLDSSVDTAVIGRWGVKRIDDGGVWVRAQLDARSEYINEIKELVDNDALGFSSGTMGHLVKVAPKTGEILKWALVELSLTPNPANPNAYIVRGNKSASAHVKSLFATKHGDHDQSEHGNWASGEGRAAFGDEKEKSKPGFYGSDHWDKPGMPKTVVVSEMSRDKYDRAILPMPEKYVDGSSAVHGRSAWTAVTTADSNGWLDENDDVTKLTSGLDIPYIPAENITSPEAWLFALGFANGTLALAPSEDDNGNVIEGMSRTRDKEDFMNLSDRLTDVNSHSSAATFDSLIATWDDFGPGASKKSLKVKRSTKHGDHDQSEHGNWSTGGGGSDKGERGKHDPALTNDQWRAMEAVSVDSANIARHATVLGTFAREMSKDMEGDGNDASRRAWDLAAQYADAVGGGSVNLREYVQDNPHGETAAQIAGSIDQEAQSMEQAQRSMEEFWQTAIAAAGGINTPSEVANSYSNQRASVAAARDNASRLIGAKTFRVKRSTKHGDHDQSEHGNWATGGGGNDKESRDARASSEREMNRRGDPRYQEKFGDKGRFDGGPKSEKAGMNLINFMEKSGADASQTEAMRSRFEKVQELAKEGNGKQAQTVAAEIRDRGAMYLRQAEVAEKHGDITDDAGVSRSAEQLTQLGNAWSLLGGHAYDIANPSESPSSDGPDDKFNDYMSGYEVPGYPKTLRAKRT